MSPFSQGEDLLRALEGLGWQVRRSASPEPLLPASIQQRYSCLPKELTQFLSGLDLCTNKEQTVWFMTREDYAETDPAKFEWDFCESLSLESAESDAEAQVKIRSFWDRHFPFMLAVHSDYDYLAISLAERSYGEIVHGSELYFESPTTVAPSFLEFLIIFKGVAEGKEDEGLLSFFL
jgi:hypothetical protein